MFDKIELLKTYNLEKGNVGSFEAQIVFINFEIMNVIDHLKKNHKDVPAKRSMLRKIAKQKRLLNYLKNNNYGIYSSLSKKLQEEKSKKK